MNTLTGSVPGSSASRKLAQRAGKYLSFGLGKEEFAIQVLRVREIMTIQGITAAPETPVHAKGMLNLRGKVIPVVDLRLKFGCPEIEYTERTSMIGIIVDQVSELLTFEAADIEDKPDFGAFPHQSCSALGA